jgi:hypothetical protein
MNQMKVTVVLALGLCGCSVEAHDAGIYAQSLCEKPEVIIGACTLKGKPAKTVSLCAAGPSSATQYVDYRFGTKTKIEMNHRVDTANTKNPLFRGTYMGGANQTTLVWFNKGIYTYKLAVPGTGVANLSVLKNGKQVFSKDCTSNVVGDIDTPNALLTSKDGEETFDMLLAK